MQAKQVQNTMRRGIAGNIAYHLATLLSKLTLKITVVGQENLPADKPYLIIANHETYVDGLWIANSLPKNALPYFSALAGADLLTDYGYFGKLLCKVGRTILIDRKGNPLRGLIAAKNHVISGNILLVHPEGTRTHNGELEDFQSGAAYIAIKAHVPIVPIYIDGGYQIFNRHMKHPQPFAKNPFRRKSLILKIGSPFSTVGHKDPHLLTENIKLWFIEQQAQRQNKG